MEFEWSSEQQQRISKFTEFAKSFFPAHQVEPGFDETAWNACAEAGLFKLPLPTDTCDGSNAGLLTTVAAFETLGRHGADAGLLFAMGAHLFGCTLAISRYASASMRDRWCKLLANGQAVAALTITEPTGGSNLQHIKTFASKDGEHYVINGDKTMISNAPVADLFLVLTATKPEGGIFGLTTFLIPKSTPGVDIEEISETNGLEGAPMGRVHFENCRLTENEILGSLNSGFNIFSKAIQWERSCILAGFLGAAQRDIDACVYFVNERQGENGSIATHQSVSHRIARMQVRLEAARQLMLRAVWSVEQGKKDAYTLASMAKYQASETLVQNTLDAMRIHAGSGWAYQPSLGKTLLGSIGTLFASGTSDIQLNIIAAASGIKRR